MIKKIFVTLAVVMAGALGAAAQQPISWTISAKMSNDSEGILTLRADIESPWHLYATALPKGGPQPTTFLFETPGGLEWTAPLQAKSKLVEEEDRQFGMTLKFYENKAVFTRPFRLAADAPADLRVKVNVRFMGCNNETCLPPRTVELSLDRSKFRNPVK